MDFLEPDIRTRLVYCGLDMILNMFFGSIAPGTVRPFGVGVNQRVNFSGQTTIWIHITVWPEKLTLSFTPTRGYTTEEKNGVS